jgi:hypothetical protein
MNNVRLDGFEPRDQVFAITSAAQCGVIYSTLFPKKLLFNCLKEVVSRFQARFGVLLLLNDRRIHAKSILCCAAGFNLFSSDSAGPRCFERANAQTCLIFNE